MCKRRVARVLHIFLLRRNRFLGTGKKTVTVPWNDAAKLEEINRIIKDGGGAKQYPFETCPEASWKACMDDTDKHLKVADKPSHKGKQWAHQELHQRESLKCSGYIGNWERLSLLRVKWDEVRPPCQSMFQ